MLTPDDGGISERAGDVGQFLAQLVAGLATLTLFMEKVLKPWRERQRKAQGVFMREVLAPELEMIADATRGTAACADGLRRIGEELDLFFELALDNRERADEMNDLLDTAGLTSADRRSGEERRQRVDGLLATLTERRRQRARRSTDSL